VAQTQLDGCIVWNAHHTVFGSKRLAICAQAVYFLHSTMPSVTSLRLSDVSVICCVTNLRFPIQACFYATSLSHAAHRRTWFTQYRTSDRVENLGRFLFSCCVQISWNLTDGKWVKSCVVCLTKMK